MKGGRTTCTRRRCSWIPTRCGRVSVEQGGEGASTDQQMDVVAVQTSPTNSAGPVQVNVDGEDKTTGVPWAANVVPAGAAAVLVTAATKGVVEAVADVATTSAAEVVLSAAAEDEDGAGPSLPPCFFAPPLSPLLVCKSRFEFL